ncbi:tripartite tricarboxylate transporter TctB family protein [Streptosporangium sp. NPDC002544]|uniref:tripartite tricarboxylate transporter TctB family protein n=1 Tax=Streptosporangium sp. NPDC002544 TaxID=3154538 RepID=UPI00332D243A
MTKIRLYRLNSLVIMLFALGVMAYALSLPLGGLQQPGAGMWPLAVSVVMALAALGLLVGERDDGDYEPLTRRTWIIVAGFGLMGAFIVIFSIAGLTLASFLMCLVWLRFMAEYRWRTSLVLSIALTAIAVLTFSVMLGIPMPHDVLNVL